MTYMKILNSIERKVKNIFSPQLKDKDHLLKTWVLFFFIFSLSWYIWAPLIDYYLTPCKTNVEITSVGGDSCVLTSNFGKTNYETEITFNGMTQAFAKFYLQNTLCFTSYDDGELWPNGEITLKINYLNYPESDYNGLNGGLTLLAQTVTRSLIPESIVEYYNPISLTRVNQTSGTLTSDIKVLFNGISTTINTVSNFSKFALPAFSCGWDTLLNSIGDLIINYDIVLPEIESSNYIGLFECNVVYCSTFLDSIAKTWNILHLIIVMMLVLIRNSKSYFYQKVANCEISSDIDI
jgi:hypothetical protein